MRTIPLLIFIFMLSMTSLAQADHVKINNAYIPDAPPVSRVRAAFMEIENNSDTDSHIVAISSPDFGAIEMHLSQEIDGVASMAPQAHLTIPAKGQLVLKPGSYHLMLFRPQKYLKKGETSMFTFAFGNGESFSIAIPVK